MRKSPGSEQRLDSLPTYEVTPGSSRLGREQGAIDVAPRPMHTSFEVRADEGMTRVFVVPVGVLVLCLLTTADMATCQTHSESRPGVTEFDACSTDVGLRFHVLNL